MLRIGRDPEDRAVTRFPRGSPSVERLEAPPVPWPVGANQRIAIVDLGPQLSDRFPAEVERDLRPNIEIDSGDEHVSAGPRQLG